MTIQARLRMTASEQAMGRYMRAPDHPTEDDQFAAAFASFGSENGGPPAADDKGGEGDAGADGAAAAGAADGSGDGGDGAGADGAGADGEGADGDAAKPKEGEGEGAAAAAGGSPAAGGDDKDKSGKDADDAILDRIAEAVAKRTPAAPAAPAGEGAGGEAPPEQPLYTAEEQATLDAFEKDWADVSVAFDLKSRALAHSVLKFAFEQIGNVLGPVKQTVDALASRSYVTDLEAATGGYTDEEVDAVTAWVDEQPTYLQKAMKDVINGGTVEEVADLVGRYREAKGIKPAGAGEPAPKSQGGDEKLSGAAKKAAEALAPVDSQRSQVSTPNDPGDFDAAFGNFAELMSGTKK